MMLIHDRIWLAGSGQYGFEMSHTLDCNIYLVGDGNEFALIDAGAGREPERIAAHVNWAGFSMEQVTHLLLTHVHADHAAGARYFHDTYGMKVVASAEAAPWLEQADMDKTSLNAAIAGGVYPADFQFPACPVHMRVKEGDSIRIGTLSLNVLETPGHSKGHISFFMEDGGGGCLFAGDTVFAGGKVVIQNIWDCSIQDYAHTIDKLSALRIESLFPGHGPFLRTSAVKHIEKAKQHFLHLAIPPNL